MGSYWEFSLAQIFTIFKFSEKNFFEKNSEKQAYKPAHKPGV